MSDLCRVRETKHPDSECCRAATLYVHRRGQPSRGRYVCQRHAGKLIREMGEPDETICVVVLP